ncbi:MAG: hypothetical protein ABEH89_00395 [bacterium]
MKTSMRFVGLCLALSFLTASFSSIVFAGAGGFTSVQNTTVLKQDTIKMTGGARFESGREYGTNIFGSTIEYDNFRVHPLKFEYGLGSIINPQMPVQAGASISYSSNSGDLTGSGLEGISLFGQMKVNDNISPQAGLKIAGSDDIAPYTNDGLDLWFNVPASVNLQGSPGSVYGEVGYTIKGGVLDNYANYGVGYRYELNNKTDVSAELAGHGKLATGTESFMELRGEADYELGRDQYLTPSLSLGVSAGSPTFALGVEYSRTL